MVEYQKGLLVNQFGQRALHHASGDISFKEAFSAAVDVNPKLELQVDPSLQAGLALDAMKFEN